MEFIGAVKELGPYVVLAIMGALIVWSNSKSNEQQSKNMGGVIELSGKISNNSDRVTDAVEKFAAVTTTALNGIATSLQTAEKQAVTDETARTSATKSILLQLSNISAVLNALTDQFFQLATKEDISNLAGTLEMLKTISATLLEIKTVLGNVQT